MSARGVFAHMRRTPPPLLMAGAVVGAILVAGLINRHELGAQHQAGQHLAQAMQEMTDGFSRFLPLVAPPGARNAPLSLSSPLLGPVGRYGQPDADALTVPGESAGRGSAGADLLTGPNSLIPPGVAEPQKLRDAPDKPATVSKTVEVGRGDTLIGLLTDAGVAVSEAHDAVGALRALFDPRHLQLGQEITLTFSRAADTLRLLSMKLTPSVERSVAVQRQNDGAYTANAKALPLTLSMAHTGGKIDGSLFATGQRLGIPPAVMVEMVRLFSYDVDFQRDIQPGDRFDVYFERYAAADGRIAKDGNILYASMTIGGQPHRFYRYQSKDGEADYYNPAGHSIRRALLRTPLDGARITSGFGMREHPILGYTKMHKGVDFGAPVGTPIMAAGDGTIDRVGWFGGYGKYVRIRHNSEYSTAYAHMSGFANLHQGEHVHQGQVIGYVGSTGRATGPHLHYEVLVHNVQVNPMSVRLPSGRTLEGTELARFKQDVEAINRKMSQNPATTLVAQSGK